MTILKSRRPLCAALLATALLAGSLLGFMPLAAAGAGLGILCPETHPTTTADSCITNVPAMTVDGGESHSCVLLILGNVDCYGHNSNGQSQDYTGGDAVAVSAGAYHTCVLLASGKVDCYGYNDYSQAQDYTGGNAAAVSAGGEHTCILLTTGNVDCYGSNSFSQAQDYNGGDATAVSAGIYHTCILLATGNVDCFGFDYFGQAQDYTGGDAAAVSIGVFHTCILLDSGNVDCYGQNDHGQAQDYAGGNAVAVSAGAYHTCILLTMGNVDCYGQNDYGQAQDFANGHVESVGAGAYHTCVVLTTGNVDCYGDNRYGQAADYHTPTSGHVEFAGGSASPSIHSVGTPAIPGESKTTPEVESPATCTAGPCATPTTIPPLEIMTPGIPAVPIGTPSLPVARECVPPLLCLGPFTVPGTNLGSTPPVPRQDVPLTPEMSVPAACAMVPALCLPSKPLLASQQIDTPPVESHSTPPIDVNVTSSDWKWHVIPNVGKWGALGPIKDEFPTPFGPVPYEICPDTCLLPADPSVMAQGSITISLTMGNDRYGATVPLEV